MQILIGHISEETAYVVKDYPYGFRLRCQIRYWLDFNPKRGVRLISQTSNPKRSELVWNKPKASTYARFGGCMFLDENNYVQWSGLTEYTNAAEVVAWCETYGTGVPEDCKPLMNKWCDAKQAYETAVKSSKEEV